MGTWSYIKIYKYTAIFMAAFFTKTSLTASEDIITENSKIYDQGTARILTLDGGGMRGIVTACILVAIEKKTHKRISDLFHLIVGTSAGGILSTFLTVPDENNPSQPKYSAEDLLYMLIKTGRRVFTYNPWSFNGLLRPKYKMEEFRSVLQEKLQNSTTKEVTKPTAVLVFDTHKKEITELSSWGPHTYQKESVVAATSAFPGYFAPVVISHVANDAVPRVFIDGGLGACDPTLTTMTHAFKLFPRASRFEIVSIATGNSHTRLDHEDIKNLGFLGWLPHLPQLLSTGHMKAEENFLTQSYGEFRNGSRYTRFNPLLDSKHDAIDDTTPENMLGLINTVTVYLSQNNAKMESLVARLMEPIDDVEFRQES